MNTKFTMEFDCDNAAFEEYTQGEIVRILKDVAHKVSNGQEDGRVMDINGNGIGQWSIDEQQ